MWHHGGLFFGRPGGSGGSDFCFHRCEGKSRPAPGRARWISSDLKARACGSSEIFFVDLPGVNRLRGRLDLVYDPWLYPVFESIGLAEPRSIWLAQALSTGPVRVVVSTVARPRIEGLGRPLTELGYEDPIRVGDYFIWHRRTGDGERARASVDEIVK